MTTTAAIGLIIGHGYTKAQGPGGTTCFPSVAALAPTHEGQLVDTALGTPRTSVIEVDDGSTWIAGTTALITAPNRLVSILDRARYGSPSFVALAHEALLRARHAQPRAQGRAGRRVRPGLPRCRRGLVQRRALRWWRERSGRDGPRAWARSSG